MITTFSEFYICCIFGSLFCSPWVQNFCKAYHTPLTVQFGTKRPTRPGKSGKYLQQIAKKINRIIAWSHHWTLRHPVSLLRHWYNVEYLRIYYEPGPNNSTTFLGLCSQADYWQWIASPMIVTILMSTPLVDRFVFMFTFRRQVKKVC